MQVIQLFCIARALPENGKITTIEVNDEIQWLSEKYFESRE